MQKWSQRSSRKNKSKEEFLAATTSSKFVFKGGLGAGIGA